MASISTTIPDADFGRDDLPSGLPDPIIAAGTIFLVDFGREDCFPRNRKPDNGDRVQNIAWEQARTIIGSGEKEDFAGIWGSQFDANPEMGVTERTARKGMHVMVSHTTLDDAERWAGLELPLAIKTYIHANLPGHSFYVSIWGELTRLSTQGTAGADAIGDFGKQDFTPTINAWVFNQQPSAVPASGGRFVGGRSFPNTHSLGPFFRNVAMSDWLGTKPLIGQTVSLFWFGQHGGWLPTQKNKSASGVIRRITIEDLTESDRTYAAADALDKSLYDAAMDVDGRFGSDTWSDPVTEVP